MKKVEINEAITRLSKLVDEASKGEPFVITKAGKPVVKVVGFANMMGRRLGFMSGQISVPKNFERMNRRGVEQMFVGKNEAAAVKAKAAYPRNEG